MLKEGGEGRAGKDGFFLLLLPAVQLSPDLTVPFSKQKAEWVHECSLAGSLAADLPPVHARTTPHPSMPIACRTLFERRPGNTGSNKLEQALWGWIWTDGAVQGFWRPLWFRRLPGCGGLERQGHKVRGRVGAALLGKEKWAKCVVQWGKAGRI